MVFEKIKLKKGSGTMTGLVIGLLIAMVIFSGGYLYTVGMIESANLTMDDKYNESYSRVEDSRDDLQENVNAIESSFNNVTEAPNAFEAAWNGMKGLGAALKLPITFVGTTIATYQAIIPTMDILPGWVFIFIFIGISAFVVFLVLKILKGEPNM